jgi:hypothetical protein
MYVTGQSQDVHVKRQLGLTDQWFDRTYGIDLVCLKELQEQHLAVDVSISVQKQCDVASGRHVYARAANTVELDLTVICEETD